MYYIRLNNGVQIPMLGFGVFQISPTDCEQCVLDAIDIGYRLIDTAQSYFNEEQVGNAISKCNVPRNELFITTKVWIDNYGYNKTIASINESMKKLKVDYLDLVLLHQPFGNYYSAYHALEQLYKEGKLRSIGVSNFYPDRLADIATFNQVIPQVNQVETNPFNQQIDAQENMDKNNVQIEAWAPLGEGRKNIFQNVVLVALANKYQKSVAQIILRWLMQRKVIALVKSVRKERMAENFKIFDFVLAEEDMNIMATLDTKESLFFNHQTPETVAYFSKLIEKRSR